MSASLRSDGPLASLHHGSQCAHQIRTTDDADRRAVAQDQTRLTRRAFINVTTSARGVRSPTECTSSVITSSTRRACVFT